MKSNSILLFSLFLLTFTSLSAQTVIVGWDMQGVSGSAASATAQFMAQGIQTTNSGVLTRGSGLSPVSLSNCFRSSNWSQGTTVQAAVNDNSYLRFVVAPATGYTLDISSIHITFQTTQTGPDEFELRSSTDGFQTFTNHGGLRNIVSTNPISHEFQFINITGSAVPVEFRIYGFAATSSSGRGQVQNASLSANDPYDMAVMGTLTLDPNAVIQCPTANFSSPSSSCLGESVSFTQLSSTPVGTTLVSYNWNFGDGNTSTTASPNHTFFQAGTFNVRLIVTNSDFCSDTLTNQIVINAQLSVSIDAINTAYCENSGDVALTGNPSGGTFSGAGVSGNIFSPSAAGVGGPYNITYQVGSGACSGSAQTSTSVIPAPVAGFTQSATMLTATFTNTSTNANQYFWEFGDGNTSTLQNPQHIFATDGDYTVCLSSITNGCEDIFCQDITVSSIVGLAEKNTENIRLYPVPFQDNLKIDFAGKSQTSISVINTSGQIIWNAEKVNSPVSIQTSEWAKGMYWILIDNAEGSSQNFKIVKQ